ncbi:hypothetical protein RYX36_037066 [Vicia faba]
MMMMMMMMLNIDAYRREGRSYSRRDGIEGGSRGYVLLKIARPKGVCRPPELDVGQSEMSQSPELVVTGTECRSLLEWQGEDGESVLRKRDSGGDICAREEGRRRI